jgi:hypothetical protein
MSLVPSGNNLGGPASPERERYTVLLLDEDQFERFLARPRARDVVPMSTGRASVWARAPRFTVRRAAVSLAVLAAAGTVWARASADRLEAPVAAAAPVIRQAPSVATGASFTVRVPRFAGERDARAIASRIARGGLPAFTWHVDGPLPDLLVGPFVSIDEAEHAQRALAVHGYRRSRLHVDERLRSTRLASASASPAVLAVAAPGRESLVFELTGEPRVMSGERVSATVFDVITGPIGSPIDAQEWSAPPELRLVRHIVVEADATGERGLTARVTLAEGAPARVRAEGSRLYVDVEEPEGASPEAGAPPRRARAEVAPPEAPAETPRSPAAVSPTTSPSNSAPAAMPSATSALPARPAAPGSPDEVQRYREAIAPVFARFEEIQPFLRSAVAEGSPDVLGALAGTFAELEQTLRSVRVPPPALEGHSLLTSAVQLARAAAASGSASERTVQAREATAQFQAARARLR